MSKRIPKKILVKAAEKFCDWIENHEEHIICDRDEDRAYAACRDEIIEEYRQSLKSPRKPRVLGLYWCTTPDHDEDWFIVEYTAKAAAFGHEEAEGYEPFYAKARLICAVPSDAPDRKVGWPSDALLEACGVTFMSHGDTRIVHYNGEIFQEGILEAQVRAVDRANLFLECSSGTLDEN